jgi:hypothetical protein
MNRPVRTLAALAALAVLAACNQAAPPAASGPDVTRSDDEAAVLAAMDTMMLAISANDLQAMAKLQTADGMTYRARAVGNGEMDIVGQPNAYWIDPARNDGHTYRERYWSPTVLVRGSIAVVWAPYEFWIDGETSHCGIDVFNFVRIDGAWTVSNSMWTVEPNACDELRPEDVSMIRPVQ